MMPRLRPETQRSRRTRRPWAIHSHPARGWIRRIARPGALSITPSQFVQNSVVRYGLASLFPRGAAVVGALVITPLALDTLGPVEFAFWALATQLPSLVVSPDLGLGQGVINDWAREQRREGSLRARHAQYRSLLEILGLIAVLWLLLGTLVIALYVEAQTGAAEQQTTMLTALTLALACFTAGIPGTLIGRAQLAQERGHVTLTWEGIGKTLSFVLGALALVAIGDLYAFVVATMLPPTITLWANTFRSYSRTFGQHKGSRIPLRQAITLNRTVFTLGTRFVLLQLCFVIGVAMDPFVINWMSSAEDVTYITVARRPFEFLPLFVTIFSTALWPVLARLDANEEYGRVRKLVLGASIGGGGAVLLAAYLIYSLADPLYQYLGAGLVRPSPLDLAAIGLQTAASTVVLVVTMYLNAVGAIRIQIYIMVPGTLLFAGAKVTALHLGDIHTFVITACLSYLATIGIGMYSVALVKMFGSPRPSSMRTAS